MTKKQKGSSSGKVKTKPDFGDIRACVQSTRCSKELFYDTLRYCDNEVSYRDIFQYLKGFPKSRWPIIWVPEGGKETLSLSSVLEDTSIEGLAGYLRIGGREIAVWRSERARLALEGGLLPIRQSLYDDIWIPFKRERLGDTNLGKTMDMYLKSYLGEMRTGLSRQSLSMVKRVMNTNGISRGNLNWRPYFEYSHLNLLKSGWATFFHFDILSGRLTQREREGERSKFRLALRLLKDKGLDLEEYAEYVHRATISVMTATLDSIPRRELDDKLTDNLFRDPYGGYVWRYSDNLIP